MQNRFATQPTVQPAHTKSILWWAQMVMVGSRLLEVAASILASGEWRLFGAAAVGALLALCVKKLRSTYERIFESFQAEQEPSKTAVRSRSF